MATIDEVLAVVQQILSKMSTRYDGGDWGEPTDQSLILRQDQPPGSGTSQFKVEDLPIPENTYVGRLTGDVTTRSFAQVLSDIDAAASGHTHSHSAITGVTSDQHHAQLHQASHAGGGADAITSLGAHSLTGDVNLPAGATDYGQAPGKTLQLFGATVYVNGLQISGGPTGFGPLLVPVGSDSSAHLDLRGKGVNGRVRAYNNSADREVATISGDQTLTDKTLTTPKIEKIHDPTQNLAVLELAGVASAVNWLKVTSSAGTDNVALEVTGGAATTLQIDSALSVADNSISAWKEEADCQFNCQAIDDDTANRRARFTMRRARGSKASLDIVQSGDWLGSISYTAYGNAEWKETARIQGEVDGALGATYVPGRIEFMTGMASVAPTTRATLDSAGDLLIESTNELQLYDSDKYLHANATHLYIENDATDGNIYLDPKGDLIIQENGSTKATFSGTTLTLNGPGSGSEDPTLQWGVANELAVQYDGTSKVWLTNTYMRTAGYISIADGVAAPATLGSYAHIYVDSADGDLKVKFGDGHVATIATDS